MAGLCKVTLIGNVGRDPEIRYTSNGTAVVNISVATTWKKKGGEEHTQWHRITIYDKLAEITNSYVRKGRQVFIEGRLNYSTYTDRDGNEKHQTEIIASELLILGSKEEPRERKTEDEDVPF